MAPKSPKKRKSSELDDDQPRNGNRGTSKVKRRKGKSSSTEIDTFSNVPSFRVSTLRSPDDTAPDGAFIGKAVLGQDFEGYYAIESLDPDVQWENIKIYRNVKRQS